MMESDKGDNLSLIMESDRGETLFLIMESDKRENLSLLQKKTWAIDRDRERGLERY
jgi:hypothetical protein